MNLFEQQKAKVRTQPGFIAALDQSGGSTPKALKLYGIERERLVRRGGDDGSHPRHARAHHVEPQLQR